MENQKEMSYYTPTIEELHIGYQCEITYAKDLIGTRDEYFFKYIVEPQYFNERDYVAIRTPFLTKEQIEAEGWEEVSVQHRWGSSTYYKLIKEITIEDEDQEYTGREYRLSCTFKPNALLFIDKHPMYYGKTHYDGYACTQIFQGKISSINEFRTLMKWIGIK